MFDLQHCCKPVAVGAALLTGPAVTTKLFRLAHLTLDVFLSDRLSAEEADAIMRASYVHLLVISISLSLQLTTPEMFLSALQSEYPMFSLTVMCSMYNWYHMSLVASLRVCRTA
jgi:hypothetical protein